MESFALGRWDWSPLRIALGSAAAVVLYGLILAIYRLYLSPLSKFPGPKLAAVTQWYESYYELAGDGGHFTKRIKQMHEKYGPIVRINPYEIHIDDPEYHEIVYAASKPYDKLPWWQNRFNIPRSTFSTAAHGLHKSRRAALNPFFSRQRMQSHGPFMQSIVERVSERLAEQYAGKSRPVILNDVYACITADIITNLAFDYSYELVERDEWDSPFTIGMKSLVYTGPWTTQLPWIIPMMNMTPYSILTALSPTIKPVLDYQNEMGSRIRDLLSGKDHAKKSSTRATVFVELLNSRLPKEELSEGRLQNEAVSIIGAGLETTKWALTVATYHILANFAVLQRLRHELVEAIPDPTKIPPWEDLQRLPYLAACVEEALRLSYGCVQRSPRISWETPFHYDGWMIPAGTPISLDTYHMHHDENVFPNSFEYKPERWLGNPKGPDGVKQLSRYMVAFGKGTRQCLGMTMAYAEMYLVLATIFRRFELQLFKTTREDVDFYHDMTTPQPKPSSLGVRVTVEKII